MYENAKDYVAFTIQITIDLYCNFICTCNCVDCIFEPNCNEFMKDNLQCNCNVLVLQFSETFNEPAMYDLHRDTTCKGIVTTTCVDYRNFQLTWNDCFTSCCTSWWCCTYVWYTLVVMLTSLQAKQMTNNAIHREVKVNSIYICGAFNSYQFNIDQYDMQLI